MYLLHMHLLNDDLDQTPWRECSILLYMLIWYTHARVHVQRGSFETSVRLLSLISTMQTGYKMKTRTFLYVYEYTKFTYPLPYTHTHVCTYTVGIIMGFTIYHRSDIIARRTAFVFCRNIIIMELP